MVYGLWTILRVAFCSPVSLHFACTVTYPLAHTRCGRRRTGIAVCKSGISRSPSVPEVMLNFLNYNPDMLTMECHQLLWSKEAKFNFIKLLRSIWMPWCCLGEQRRTCRNCSHGEVLSEVCYAQGRIWRALKTSH